MTAKTTTTDPARFAQFADLGNREDFVIPESTDDLTDAELATLLSGAREAFDALYGDGQDLTESDLDALGELTRGIESLDADLAERQEAAAERKARADELAAKVRPADAEEDESEADEDDADDAENADEGDDAQDADEADNGGESADEAPEAADEEQEALVASSARRGVRVNMSRARARHLRRPEGSGKAKVADLLTSASDSLGFAQGQGVSWDGATSMLERRMQGFSQSAYANAASRGKHLRSQAGLLSVRKPLADGQLIRTGDATEVSEVLNRVADERTLSGGSLVAAGGWGAPSTVMYDVLELETREGIFTLPEVGVVRGGFHFTKGPNFADLFEQFTGFSYTEEQDISGDYDGEGGGAKPCHRIDDPEFEEVRLGVEGLCITSGLLQRRGYPELVQRVLRGALVAHDHRVSARVLSEVADGSTDVTFEDASGTLAPILTAIEVQAESIRQRQRMARNATIEGIFPMWTRGAVRTDLSHRLGVDLLDVTDQRIDAWFRSRGISPQFVYNWQDLSTDETINAWPTEVRFLMYPAGTWVRGTSEIITVDTLFDSTQLGTNDYTALFTEEGVATVKRGWESREVTVPITEPGTVEAIVNSAGGATADEPAA